MLRGPAWRGAPPSPGPGGAAPSRSERAPRLRCRSERPRREQGSETEGAGEGGSACGGARRLRAARERRAQPPTLPGLPGPLRGGGGGAAWLLGAYRCAAPPGTSPQCHPGTRASRPRRQARSPELTGMVHMAAPSGSHVGFPAAGRGASAQRGGELGSTAEARLPITDRPLGAGMDPDRKAAAFGEPVGTVADQLGCTSGQQKSPGSPRARRREQVRDRGTTPVETVVGSGSFWGSSFIGAYQASSCRPLVVVVGSTLKVKSR